MDQPIATILFGTFLVLPPNYLPADGRCLAMGNFPKAVEALHVGSYWPYGKCMYGYGFNLPNTCDQYNKCAIIKVQ